MRKLHTHIALICFVILSSFNAFSQAVSDFDSGNEGWMIVNIGTGPTPSLTYSSTNGAPNGTIYATDGTMGTGIFYFVGGPEFKGDLSAYYNGSLTFDLKMNAATGSFIPAPDMIIVKSDGAQIVSSMPASVHPNNSWKNFSLSLNEYYWNYTTTYGEPVTASDMMVYLSDVKEIYIRGDYKTSVETSWLDNVMISGTPILLPVELSDFDGIATSNNTVELNWTTLTENDCLGFGIEKSMGNNAEFSEIGFVAGNGTTTDLHNYTFTDDNFTAAAYYRLKQLDNSGDVFYSRTIYIASGAHPVVSSQVYPNPANNVINIATKGDVKNITGLQVTDMFGNIVYSNANYTTSSDAVTSLEISNFTSGMYFLMITSDQGNESLPFQVVR